MLILFHNRWLMGLLLNLIGLSVYGQNIQGKVTDQEGGIPQVEIRNLSNGSKTFSDRQGNFKLQAEANDSLSFENIFYFTETIKLTPKDFKESLHIELTKKDFNLDEITLIAPSKKFDPEKYDADLKSVIAADMKKNPSLYSPGSKIGTGANILGIVDLAVIGVSKLFGIQKKEKEIIRFIVFEDLEDLFKNDSFFNDKLLYETLQIEEDRKYVFFAYCEERYMDYELLKPENQFLLLDKLVDYAEKFRANSKSESE